MSDLTVTNMDIWLALVNQQNPSLPGPLAELVALDTPLPASNTLRRSLRLAQAEFPTLDADRVKLVERYAAKDEGGKEIPDGKGGIVLTDKAAFDAGFASLMACEVTLPGAQAVPISGLGNVIFSGAKLNLLSKFVTE
jgi:hypothetical protein